MEPAEKWCSRCGAVLPASAFSTRGRGRTDLQAWCRECMKASARIRNRRRRGLPDDAPRADLVDRLPAGTTRVHRGYILERVHEHHRADRYRWVYQHILVAEKKFGIRITRDFTVHHINGDRGDNRPENLELRFGNHGKGADALPGLLRNPANRAIARAILSQYTD